MPIYLHQFKYKDEQVRNMLQNKQSAQREEIVRAATHVFGGELLGFYFCFGEFDGVAVSQFPNDRQAMACAMTIFGQGRVQNLQTTPLFTMAEALEAIRIAQAEIPDAESPPPPR